MRRESLAATAAVGRRWLLVEVAGGWGPDVFTDSSVLDPGIGRALVRRAQAAGMRIAAIRRPGRGRGSGRWRWCVAHTDPGVEHLWWGEVGGPPELLRLPLDGSAGLLSAEPLIAVCAHGRHDECCAVRGRAVAATLAASEPDQTWECSHIGGDRFAATMILFPHGLNFGRVDELNAPDIVHAYRQGRITAEGFRGRTAFDRVVQAAQDVARRSFGDDRVDAYRPVSVEGAGRRWRVELAAAPPVVIEVEQHTEAPLFTMCNASVPVAVPTYVARMI